MTGLIDSTEMYLRTLYELREEDVRPLRARLVERLRLSAPAVSEATARLASVGLVEVGIDRMVHLTEPGLARATQVMRKHRLAELLLSDVIGLDWRLVHQEACRWEHVISDDVEQRLTVVLGDPQHCPHGNLIPTAAAAEGVTAAPSAPKSLLAAAGAEEVHVTLAWLSESLQTDDSAIQRLYEAGLLPGTCLAVSSAPNGVRVQRLDEEADQTAAGPDLIELDAHTAGLIYVESAKPDEGKA